MFQQCHIFMTIDIRLAPFFSPKFSWLVLGGRAPQIFLGPQSPTTSWDLTKNMIVCQTHLFRFEYIVCCTKANTHLKLLRPQRSWGGLLYSVTFFYLTTVTLHHVFFKIFLIFLFFLHWENSDGWREGSFEVW